MYNITMFDEVAPKSGSLDFLNPFILNQPWFRFFNIKKDQEDYGLFLSIPSLTTVLTVSILSNNDMAHEMLRSPTPEFV